MSLVCKRLYCDFVVVTLVIVVLASRSAYGYHPKSPEVKKLVDSGLAYLAHSAAGEPRLGGKCIIALAALKAADTYDRDPFANPLLQHALDACRDACKRDISELGGNPSHATIYNAAVALIFLCEVDPIEYRPEIDKLLAFLLKVQKPHGGWGYEHEQDGDNSQTQYGVLAIWSAWRAQIPVPTEAAERAINYLIRVQDPRGGWAYKGRIGNTRVPQGELTLSLSAAGLSSIYIASDMLGFTQKKQANDPDVPAALQIVEKKQDKDGPRTDKVNPGALSQTMGLGNAWFARNFSPDSKRWRYYYLYGYERYESFRELSEGRKVKEPDWYNKGYAFLKSSQQDDGSWVSESKPQVSTAFAILFLVRSTQKTISKVVNESGLLTGGNDLPKDVTNVQVGPDGQIKKPATYSKLDDILDLALQDGNEDLVLPDKIELDANVLVRDKQKEMLRKMISDPVFEKRLLAVRGLAEIRDFDNVPQLIYALSDPDWRIVMEARDGLRRISRKYEGFGLPDKPTEDQQKLAKQRWSEWYLSLRPDGELLD